MNITQVIQDKAQAARRAARVLALTTTLQRNEALRIAARELEHGRKEVLAANAVDVAAAKAADRPGAMVQRLTLTDSKMTALIKGCEDVAALPDPLGEVVEEWSRPNGLRLQKVRVPMGVIGMIYESRPNVTVDAAILCLKAGSAVLLKGGQEAEQSNRALTEVLRRAMALAGLPADVIQLVPGGREGANALMQASGLIDVLIPRGGAGLIRSVLENARVPVIETGTGVCHVYVDEGADLDMATRLIVNAKCSNPAVCNAAETLLVHESVAATFLPKAGAALRAAGVTLRGCARTQERLPWAEAATDEDWATEYLDLMLAVRVVDSLPEALAHIAQWGTLHSETIVTSDAARAEQFLNEVDAAAVYWNASTRFTDGFEFGFGAEIGISTQKLHARGPMGLREITTYKYVARGDGQVR